MELSTVWYEATFFPAAPAELAPWVHCLCLCRRSLPSSLCLTAALYITPPPCHLRCINSLWKRLWRYCECQPLLENVSALWRKYKTHKKDKMMAIWYWASSFFGFFLIQKLFRTSFFRLFSVTFLLGLSFKGAILYFFSDLYFSSQTHK